MKKRIGARFGAFSAGILLVASSAGLAAADEQYDLGDEKGEGPNLQIPGQSWSVITESRVFEGQENIPFIIRYGQPTTQIELISPPVQCEGYAAQYYAGDVPEQAVLGTTGLYYNRTMARSRNPKDGGKGVGGAPQRTPKVETGPGTAAAGPYAVAECPNRATGHALARMSGVEGGPSQAVSESSTKVDPVTKTTTSESTAVLKNFALEGGASVEVLYSYLKAVHEIDKEPKFTYELRVQGITADGNPISGIGDQGIVFAGNSLAGPDAVKQFNEQANSQAKALEAVFVYSLSFASPKFYVDTVFDKFNFEAPVAEGSILIPARKGTIGDYQAGRLAVNNYRGVYTAGEDSE